jgi:hypothetical protein
VTGSHAKQVLREKERRRTGTYAYKRRRLLHGLIYIRSFTSLSFDFQRAHTKHTSSLSSLLYNRNGAHHASRLQAQS